MSTQLELFKTPQQEEKLAFAIERHSKREAERCTYYHNVLRILKDNHFIEGYHYKLTGTAEFIEEYKAFAYGRYNEPELSEEVLVKIWNGDIKFLYSQFNSDAMAIEKCERWVDMENGKFNISALQNNYRYIKAETLRGKLDDSHQSAKRRLEIAVKQDTAVKEAMAILKYKYPKAKVTRSTYDDNITIEFQNGNYVTYRVWGNGNLSEQKCYIKTIQSLTGDDKLNMIQNL